MLTEAAGPHRSDRCERIQAQFAEINVLKLCFRKKYLVSSVLKSKLKL